MYSVNYANFQTCTWKIDIPSGKGFTLFFENGAVLEDGKDYLKVRT
jgi:hypothetical protein